MKTNSIHNIHEGDIFCAAWGDKFRSVRFFRVTGKTKMMVELLEVAGKTVRKTGSESSIVEANPTVKVGEPKKYKAMIADGVAWVSLGKGNPTARRVEATHQERRGTV